MQPSSSATQTGHHLNSCSYALTLGIAGSGLAEQSAFCFFEISQLGSWRQIDSTLQGLAWLGLVSACLCNRGAAVDGTNLIARLIWLGCGWDQHCTGNRMELGFHLNIPRWGLAAPGSKPVIGLGWNLDVISTLPDLAWLCRVPAVQWQ